MTGTGAARAWESRALVPLGPTQQPLSGRPHSRCREGKGLWLWGPQSASGGPRLDRRVALCVLVPKGLTLSPDRAAVRPSAMELCGLEQRPLLRGRWRAHCGPRGPGLSAPRWPVAGLAIVVSSQSPVAMGSHGVPLTGPVTPAPPAPGWPWRSALPDAFPWG